MSASKNPLGALPTATDGVGSAAMEASLRSRLFGKSGEGVRVGRFVVGRPLGEGGMGAVFAARDPKLDRDVAIKLVRPQAGTDLAVAAERMRLEAKVLARLSHPNVVAIYEVGEHDGHVFVAMELVQGRTLGAWAQENPPGTAPRTAEALRLLTQAGRGLAAAHAVGLVHRDVKPANILVGDDGRVRIADFGLARGHDRDDDQDGMLQTDAETRPTSLTSTGVAVGTPAYMAPEQSAAQPVGPRTDQFSFCVTAWEILFGTRPFVANTLVELRALIREQDPALPDGTAAVPRAVRRALCRGLAFAPSDRYRSMTRLLAVLNLHADPGRLRRRRLAIASGGIAIAAVGAAYVVGEIDAACDPDAGLAGVWDAPRREAVRAALQGNEASFAAESWSAVERSIDQHAERWSAQYRHACDTTSAAAGCLRARRRELDALVTALITADAGAIARAPEAIAGLPDPSRCADAAGHTPPPADPQLAEAVQAARDQVARAASLRSTDRIEEALAAAQDAAATAAELGYAPLQLEARLELQRTLEAAGRAREAAQGLESVFLDAQAAGNDAIATNAALLMAAIEGGSLGGPDDGLKWLRHARAIASRGGTLDPQIEARALSLEGGLLRRKSDFDAATTALRRVIELRGEDHPLAYDALEDIGEIQAERGMDDEAEATLTDARALCHGALGADNPSCSTIDVKLARVATSKGDAAAAGQWLEAAQQSVEAAFGPDHPRVAAVLHAIARNQRLHGQPKDALATLERARDIFAATLGADHQQSARVLGEIGVLRFMQGRFADAVAPLQQALAIMESTLGSRARDTGAMHANLGIAYGGLHRFDEARIHYDAALSITREVYGADHVLVAGILANIGLLALEQDKFHEAIDYQSRALTIEIAARGKEHPNLATYYTNLGVAEAGRERHDAAIAYYEQARGLLVGLYGAEHPVVAQIVGNIGWAHAALGEQEKAAEAFDAALAIYDASNQSPTLAAPLRFELAKALRALGRDNKRARAEAERAKAAYQATAPSEATAQAQREVERIDAWLAEG